MAPSVYCIVLAAGESSRFGRMKLLENLDGKPLLIHALEAAHVACPGRVCLVTGSDSDAVHKKGKGLADFVVHNPDFASGIGSSIRRGVDALREHAEALLVVLADQPLVTAEHLSRMIATWDNDATKIIASAYSGTNGAPALFGKEYFDQLATLKGDSGAKKILQKNSASVRSVSCEPAAFDIDTPEDLDAIITGA